jgi:hypothetical protein
MNQKEGLEILPQMQVIPVERPDRLSIDTILEWTASVVVIVKKPGEIEHARSLANRIV